MSWCHFTQVICAVILVPALIAAAAMMTWHFYLLLHNKTTIEVVIEMPWLCGVCCARVVLGNFIASGDCCDMLDGSHSRLNRAL